MEIDIVIKIALIGLLVAVINQILSRLGREEYGMFTTIAGVIAVLLMLLPYFTDLLSTVKSSFDF